MGPEEGTFSLYRQIGKFLPIDRDEFIWLASFHRVISGLLKVISYITIYYNKISKKFVRFKNQKKYSSVFSIDSCSFHTNRFNVHNHLSDVAPLVSYDQLFTNKLKNNLIRFDLFRP